MNHQQAETILSDISIGLTLKVNQCQIDMLKLNPVMQYAAYSKIQARFHSLSKQKRAITTKKYELQKAL